MRSFSPGGRSGTPSASFSWGRRAKRSTIIFLAACTTCFSRADRANAVTRTWNFAGSANWSVAGDWNPTGVPAAGDVVEIEDDDSISRTITYDYTGAAVTLGSLTIDNQGSGSSNTLAMTGSGLALSAGAELIGNIGTGVLSQSVGTNTANGGLNVAPFGGSHGTYNLSGTGTLTITGANGEFVGDFGAGAFTQSNGTNNFGSFLELGANAGSSGSYTLSGGALSSAAGGGETIGIGTTGTFTQSGGNNTTTGQLILGNSTGSTGTYGLSGGTLSVGQAAMGGNFGGSGGQGDLTVSGSGVLNITGGLGILVHNTAGTSLSLEGGTINTPFLNLGGNQSLLNWTSGTLHFTTDVTFDPDASPNSTSDIFGSSLTLNNGQTLSVTGNETFGGAGAFSLTLNTGSSIAAAGSLTVTSNSVVTQNGGTISSNLTNNGAFTANSGTFSGTLINNGNASFLGNFTLGNGFTNNGSLTFSGGTLVAAGASTNNANIRAFGTLSAGSFDNSEGGIITQSGGNLTISATPTDFTNEGVINVASGFSMQLNVGNFRNDGAINLNNGTLASNSQINNFDDGLITGPGTIGGNGTFANAGLLQIPDGLTIASDFVNTGVVEMSGTAAVLSQAEITNNNTVEGFGQISEDVINNATIQPTGGTLIIGVLFNPASGLVTVGPEAKLLALEGLATNAGIISLAGGTFDNGGQPMDNTGQISGYGVLSTGGLTNDGTMILTGGTTIVDGPVQNDPGQTIVAKDQPVIFTGPVTNNGTIKATNNTVTFAGSYTGNAYISDPATNIFQLNVTVTPGGTMTGGTGDQYIMNGGTFTNQGSYSNTGLLQSSDPTINSATFTQGGTQTWSPGTTFTNTAGIATFLTDAGSATAYNLSVNITGGKVALASPQHWAGLTISGASILDVSNNHVVIDYGSGPDPIASIAGYLASGYNAGSWNGPGVDSSIAAMTPGYGLGYADSADLGNPAGLSSGTIEIKYTLLGDTNLDGVVNAIDFGILAANFNKGVTGWDKGDFNYDNVVNAIDFGELAANFNKGATGANIGPGPLSDAALVAFAQANGLMADVPEPASLALFGVAAAGLLRRQRSARRIIN